MQSYVCNISAQCVYIRIGQVTVDNKVELHDCIVTHITDSIHVSIINNIVYKHCGQNLLCAFSIMIGIILSIYMVSMTAYVAMHAMSTK